MELRKRKEAPAPPPPVRRKTTKTAKTDTASKAKGEAEEKAAPVAASTNGSSSSGVPAVGDIINLDGFGGEIETNDGTKTNLKSLVEASKAGVVIFTYPKASTPGCKSLNLIYMPFELTHFLFEPPIPIYMPKHMHLHIHAHTHN